MFHYLKLTALIVLVGVVIGIAGGTWMGRGMSRMYMEFYRVPYLDYFVRPGVALTGALVSLAAAMIGTAVSVAGLTLYDMLKSVERGAMLTDVRLVEKTGGKSGTWKGRE